MSALNPQPGQLYRESRKSQQSTPIYAVEWLVVLGVIQNQYFVATQQPCGAQGQGTLMTAHHLSVIL